MTSSDRETGIEAVGDVPWGTHLCQFYKTKEDLIDILVPYFKAGLENNEFCIWVTSEPLNEKEAEKALRKAMPDFIRYLKSGQIEIIPYVDWYLKDGIFNLQAVLNGWIDKLNQALSKGYDGMRVTGNTAWLEKRDWGSFTDYEEEINSIIGEYQMLAICTYSLDMCGAPEIVDVISNHQFALLRREGEWQIIESAERKQSFETLQESERKYRSLFASMLNGFAYCKILVDENNKPVDFVYLEINDAFEKLTGLKREEVIGKKVTEAIPGTKESHPELFNIYGKVALTGKPAQFEIYFKPLRIWLTISVYSPERGYFVAVFENVTERKQAEEELNKFKTISDQTGYGVSIASIEGKFTYVNEHYARMHGYGQKEIIGQHWSILYPEDQVEVIKRSRKRMVETGDNWVTEMWRKRKDGSIFPSITTAIVVKDDDGAPLYVSSTAIDITERKRAEESLRDSEEKLRLMFASVADGIKVVDLKGIIISANRRAAEIHGYDSEDELVGKNSYDTIKPSDRARAVRNMRETLEKGESGIIEYGLLRQDGSEFPGELSASVMKDNSGNPIGFIVVIRDITESKKGEHDIGERVKELTCLYGVSQLVAKPDASLDEILKGTVDLIPAGWQYPEVTCARVIFKGKEFKTDNFRVTEWKQSSSIKVKEEQLGTLEVYYLEEKPDFDKGPFLKEERNLIDGLARILSEMVERKQAEEELKKFKTISERAGYGVTIGTSEGKLIYVNESLARMHGYTPDELIGKHYSILYPEEEAKFVERLRNQLQETDESVAEEIWRKRKDGTIFPSFITGTLTRDDRGKPLYISSTVTDITERKQAEEEIKKFQTVIDNASYGVSIGPGENLDYVNRSFAEMHGYSPEELVGQHYSILYTEEQMAAIDKLRDKLMQTGSFVNEEVWRKKKDGSVFPTLMNGNLIRGDEGNPAILVGTVIDITERKQAEEKEKQLQQELIVSSRLASIGEMAAGIAHEINNPLTGVVGYSDLLMKKDIPENIRKDLNIINDGAQRMAGIVSRLLTFARQYGPERASVNINDIITTTLAMRTYGMETSKIKVNTRLAPDLPLTMADAGQLQQVFLNIILNAETEMKRAHGRGNLSIKTERMDNIIRVFFKDDGPGIPKENLSMIFDPFFTTREVGSGAGLGLSVCHGIIVQHGGKIYAKSKLGKGAMFTVELPVVAGAEQLRLAEPASEPSGVSEARILVVDDEPIVRQFLTEVLSEEGHEVQVVDNADAALLQIRSKQYRLILLDIKLPGISGIELYKYIQKKDKSLARRVVFITGDIMGKETQHFLSRTRAPYITKPFVAEQLKRDINRILTQDQ